MNPRLLAGLGMTLLAAGLLAIFLLQDGKPGLEQWSGTDEEPGVPEVALNEGEGPPEVQRFLDRHGAGLQEVWTQAQTAAWLEATDRTPATTTARKEARRRLLDYQGGSGTIDQLRLFRGRLDLSAHQDRQIEIAWQDAALVPGIRAEALNRLLATQAALADTLAGFAPQADETTAEPGEILATSADPAQRLSAWTRGLAVGPRLKEGLVELQTQRNILAREMGYSSFFAQQSAGYELGSQDMLRLMDDLVVGVMPLYAQLHCWVRHELADRYQVAPVPDLIPAHWLATDHLGAWAGVVPRTLPDSLFSQVQPQWIVEQSENFFTSLGFPALPVSFWTRSDLFPLESGSLRQKSDLAAAWHLDLDRDVRALMNLRPTFAAHVASHRLLGQVYYYLSYSRPEVPLLLRRPANRAFLAAMNHLAELAATQPLYLQQLGLLPEEAGSGTLDRLLDQALTGPVVQIPAACGTMAHWEHDLYEKDLPRHQFNTRWWQYTTRYQGVIPASERGEDFCDPAAQPRILAPAGRAYDKVLGQVIAHQLHRYICREILDQDVRQANYFGNARVGRYLQSILELGATRDWSLVMRQATGEELSCDALLEYYAPLQDWLTKENTGRMVGF